MQSKSIFSSKLFWLGFIQFVLGTANLLTNGFLNFDAGSVGKDAQEIVALDWSNIITAGGGLLTIVLRAITKKPVEFRLPKLNLENLKSGHND